MKSFILPDMMLFIVEERYMLTKIGLTLCAASPRGKLRTGDTVRLVRPDNTSINAVVKGIAFHEEWSIVISGSLTKEDVPVGTEVWLDNTAHK